MNGNERILASCLRIAGETESFAMGLRQLRMAAEGRCLETDAPRP